MPGIEDRDIERLESLGRLRDRGVLTDAQLQRIQDTMAALVAEIGSQSDKEPEPGVADDVAYRGMIRCVAGSRAVMRPAPPMSKP